MDINDIDLRSTIEDLTGRKFNRENKMLSPFGNEKTPSFSIHFDSNSNKYKYKDFSTGKNGDIVDFVMDFKGMGYPEAREYLGIPLEKTSQELEIDIIKDRIGWEIKTLDYRKGMELLGVFSFVDRDNKPMYYKAKFKAAEGKKPLSYYHIDTEGKVQNKRNGEELLYNLYNVLEGTRSEKVIIITEGEKDANSLNSIFENVKYVATSCKGIKDFSALRNAKIFVCGDTGEAGRKYIEKIKYELLECSWVFKIITLQGINALGDNKDITDWLESGHTKNDLYQAFKRSLDLKNKYELQQDYSGIYKSVKPKGDSFEDVKVYISNFTLLEATRINFIDKDDEGVKLVMKSCTGAKIERIDQVNVFDDIRAFKGFLGTMDLRFTGNIGDLTMLKTWINNYFALDMEEIHTGVKFINKNDVQMLITNDGALTKDKVNSSVKSEDGAEINLVSIETISYEDLKEVMKHLFIFANFEKTFSIIGSIVNFLAVLFRVLI